MGNLTGESVRHALYGASFGPGLRAPGEVLNILKKQNDEIFKSGGSKPPLNLALKQLNELRQRIACLLYTSMQVLRDQWHVLDNALVLAGRDDMSSHMFSGSPRKSLNEILADLPPEHRDLPLVVMDHQPSSLDEARTAGAVPVSYTHLDVYKRQLLDGAIRIKDLCARAKDFGMPACAITDHGNLFGAAYFYQGCKDFGIKPIFGCEVYVCHDHTDKKTESPLARKRNHLILLAQNKTGYHNLVKLVSHGFLEGFYYKPRVDKALLRKYSEGLTCLSACIAGEIPRAILADNMDLAKKLTLEYASIYPGRFYLELQSNGLKEQEKANIALMDLAETCKVPLVCLLYTSRQSRAVQEFHAARWPCQKPQDIFRTSIGADGPPHPQWSAHRRPVF